MFDGDLGHLDVAPEFAPVALELCGQILRDCADPALDLGHGDVPGGRQGERQAERTAGVIGASVGGVDGEECQHTPHLGVPLPVR